MADTTREEIKGRVLRPLAAAFMELVNREIKFKKFEEAQRVNEALIEEASQSLDKLIQSEITKAQEQLLDELQKKGRRIWGVNGEALVVDLTVIEAKRKELKMPNQIIALSAGELSDIEKQTWSKVSLKIPEELMRRTEEMLNEERKENK